MNTEGPRAYNQAIALLKQRDGVCRYLWIVWNGAEFPASPDEPYSRPVDDKWQGPPREHDHLTLVRWRGTMPEHYFCTNTIAVAGEIPDDFLVLLLRSDAMVCHDPSEDEGDFVKMPDGRRAFAGKVLAKGVEPRKGDVIKR